MLLAFWPSLTVTTALFATTFGGTLTMLSVNVVVLELPFALVAVMTTVCDWAGTWVAVNCQLQVPLLFWVTEPAEACRETESS